jgi:putative SOS response-associated peptidase YedK
MCGRYKLVTPIGKIIDEFSLTGQRPNLRARFNIAPTQESVVVRRGPTGRQLAVMRWGLVPYWAPDKKIAFSTINARAETVATKPAFRDALQSRRCLVVADGFYEWKTEGKTKLPQLFELPGGGLMAFAGLYERWEKGGVPLETFTIICTGANPSVAPIHNRMPAILPPAQWDKWLDTENYSAASVLPLLETPSQTLTVTPVSRKLNAVANDAPDVLEPDVEEQPKLL